MVNVYIDKVIKMRSQINELLDAPSVEEQRQQLVEYQTEIEHLNWAVAAFRDGDVTNQLTGDARAQFVDGVNEHLAKFGQSITIEGADGQMSVYLLAQGKRIPLSSAGDSELLVVQLAVAEAAAALQAAATVEWIEVRNEVEALMLEYGLIKQHRPKYNILLKDNKSYPFIRVILACGGFEANALLVLDDGLNFFEQFFEGGELQASLDAIDQDALEQIRQHAERSVEIDAQAAKERKSAILTAGLDQVESDMRDAARARMRLDTTTGDTHGLSGAIGQGVAQANQSATSNTNPLAQAAIEGNKLMSQLKGVMEQVRDAIGALNVAGTGADALSGG